MKFPKTFCWRPFTEINIGQGEKYKPCSCFRSTKEFNINDDIHKEIRDTILDNRWHPGCSLCESIEASGNKNSHRLKYFGPKDKSLILENKFAISC
jgi:hypothetical protein